MSSNQVSSPDPESKDGGFAQEQNEALIAIGQALLAQSTAGTVALELVVTQTVAGQEADLDIRVNLERQSGLAVPATPSDEVIETVQRLALLWRRANRDPWRTFTYRLTRGESGPRYTSEFSF